MPATRPYLILGLDPGIASCGFCLLDTNNHQILEMGSHLFKAPQEDKTKVSLAVGRRNARSVRRNIQRTKGRLTRCLALFKEHGLVPEDSSKQWLQSRKGDKPVLKLRSAGLNRRLTNREFAQVLYSLCSRRGYIPHGEGRLTDIDKSSDNGKVLSAIAANSKKMDNEGYQTVGQMLHKEGRSRNKGGNYDLCVYNAQIQDEVHKLFEAQRNIGNEKATDALESDFIECLTWEKETLDHDARTYDLVGNCSYFPDEKRAANADISSELCRAYERLKHLVIIHENGAEQRLTSQQVEEYLSVLFSPFPIKGKKGKVSYGRIREDLDLSGKSVFRGIPQDSSEKAEIFTPKSWRCLRDHLSPEFLSRMLEDRDFGDAICEALTYASTEESLNDQLAPLDLTKEEIESLGGIPFTGKLFKGYGSRSRTALDLLIEAFEEPEVTTLTEAEDASGLLALRQSDRSPRSTYLPPYKSYDPTCNNPVVLRAMGRMRRIVNSIIKIYGVPDEIHIELDRELKMSKKEKAAISKSNRENEAQNKEWAAFAAGILNCEPTEVPKRIVRKLIMCDGQGSKDVYRPQAGIDKIRLVRDEKYCEIDHVLPYSRTSDDSKANKVLTLAKNNQDKGERTPYEWMHSGEPGAPDWDEYRAHVLTAVKQPRKRANMLNANLDEKAEKAFISRNLNDTRYMSVAVKNYLEDTLLFPEDGRKKHVIAVASGATASLRWVWGLNYGANGKKDREDDRHHAVDAAVIAACSEATVQAVAKARSKGPEAFKHLRKSRLADTQPWPTFAAEVDARRDFVVPTRMANHGLSGRALEDTIYRLEGFNDKNYPLVSVGKGTAKKIKTAGNIHQDGYGAVRFIDGMAFLRLWLDPTAKGPKGTKGKWYAEPVYYADIPALRAGTYTPKACKGKAARINWDPIPSSALSQKPLILFLGDVLQVDNHLARFKGININSCRLKLSSLLYKDDEAKGIPSISKWNANTTVKVFQEDCLGHCYSDISLNIDDSSFQAR